MSAPDTEAGPDDHTGPDHHTGPDDYTVPPVDDAAWWRILRRVEASHHLDGWIPPGHGGGLRLYMIYDHTAQPELTGHIDRIMGFCAQAIRGGRLTAQPMTPKAAFMQPNMTETEALRGWAHNLAYLDVTRLPAGDETTRAGLKALPLMRSLLMEPIVVGFAVCYEAWSRAGDTAAEAFAMARSDRRFDSYADAREQRMLSCATVTDEQYFQLTRDRDTNQVAETRRPCALQPGTAATAVRLLADLAGCRLPAGQAEFDLRYPSVTDHLLEHPDPRR